MKLENCRYDLETKMVDACDNCRISTYKTHQHINFGSFRLVVTKLYEAKTCFLGFAPGDLVNAFSLLPKEEQELEIIRRHKYSTEFHEQRSVESEFETELEETIRTELSATQDFNFSVSASGEVDVLGLAEASVETKTGLELGFSQEFFKEVVRKTSSRVSNKYDVSIDIKTEAENEFRSLRKISNPNECRVVTYFFKQLNRKYSFTISLVDVRYDVISKLPPIFTTKLPYYSREITMKPATIFPASSVKAQAVAAPVEMRMAKPLFEATAAVRAVPNEEVQTISAKIQHVATPVREFKEFTAKQFATILPGYSLVAAQRAKLNAYLEKLQADPANLPHVVYQTEYCLRTNNILAEPKVSECSICEDCDDCKKPDAGE